MLGRIATGFLFVGLGGAVALGIGFVMELIFGDSSLFLRIVTGLLALVLFLCGYYGGEGAEE
ncbi:hypothetical protein GCM10008915_36460 [Bifidobacterium pullorum subsp. gallinarum]